MSGLLDCEQEEKVCGSCCHFKFEDINGFGLCCSWLDKSPNVARRCSDKCSCGGYASEGFKRHQMVVLRKCQRCLKNVDNRDMDVEDICFAIDFLIDYAKTY